VLRSPAGELVAEAPWRRRSSARRLTIEALPCQSPRRGGKRDHLNPSTKCDPGVKSVPEDVQHQAVLWQHLSHELCDAALLGDRRQSLEENRPQAAIMEMIGDLDRDFRARLVELSTGGVSDEHTHLIVGEQPVTVRGRAGGPMRGTGNIDAAAEEAQTSRVRAQVREELQQRRLIALPYRTDRH
jgi:hypothetical protein